jgi:hypothetical protein
MTSVRTPLKGLFSIWLVMVLSSGLLNIDGGLQEDAREVGFRELRRDRGCSI